MTANESITSTRDAIAEKKVSARELARDYFKRIAARNGELNAYLTLSEERAYRQADRVDATVAQGKPLPPMAGVPIAVKDVISTRGIRTTCGSKILSNYIPPSSSAKPIATNSQWAARTKTPPTVRCRIRPPPAVCPVARAADRQLSSRRTSP